MSGSYSSRLRGGGGGGGLGATTVLAAKVAFASSALAAAASLACVAVPQLVSGADAFLWKLYLFVTVHVIIFVIWKLSDTKHFHVQQNKDPWAPTPHHPAPALPTEQVILSAMKRKAEFSPATATAEVYRKPPHLEAAGSSAADEGVVSSGSCADESCVTTESEEAASSPVATPAYVAAADTRWSVAPAPVRQREGVKRGFSLPPPIAMVTTDEHFDGADHADGGDDDDLDATWNAIMQKTRPSTAPASSPSGRAALTSPPPTEMRPRSREPSVGAAELSKRSEDFINKIHNSFGR